jgi:hypothetical protein
LINTASILKLKPYAKGIHIRFAPTKEQLTEATEIARNFALEMTKK